jgi:hypothetical protein
VCYDGSLAISRTVKDSEAALSRTGDTVLSVDIDHKLGYVKLLDVALNDPRKTYIVFFFINEGNVIKLHGEAVYVEQTLDESEIEVVIVLTAVSTYATGVLVLGRLAVRLEVLVLTLLALVYGVCGADTGSLDLSYNFVVVRRRGNLFTCNELVTILAEVELVTNLITGSLLIVRILNVVVRTVGSAVLTLTVNELVSVSGLFELLTVLTYHVVLTVGIGNVPLVINLICVVILLEYGVATVAVMLVVTLLKTGRSVSDYLIIVSVRSYVIAYVGILTVYTVVDGVSGGSTSSLDVLCIVLVRKYGRGNGLLFTADSALEDLVACLGTGSLVTGDEFPFMTCGLGDNVVANAAT